MMKFIKAHGLGNDFVIIFEDITLEQILQISDRKLGIGCDQVIQSIERNGEAYVRFWNQDGSEANLCGNGIRCLGQYYANKYQRNRNKFITKSGIIHTVKFNKIGNLANNIGFSLPVVPNVRSIGNNVYDVYVGNEHIVIIGTDIPNWDQIIKQYNKYLAEKNIMYVWNDGKWNIQSWERGVGRTLACGSGAIASACALWNNLGNNSAIDKFINNQIELHTEIGKLCIVKKQHIWQIGEANIVAEGEYAL